MSSPFDLVLCSRSDASDETVEICRELPHADEAPEWIELLPPGREINGRDGRHFVNDEPARILEAFKRNAAKLPIDYEHATQLRAPKGEEAPAAGWILELETREGGALWARVEWTPRGAAILKAREYRYISPTILVERKTGKIAALISAGLTNTPNLHLTALNSGHALAGEEREMDLKKLAKLLGLPESATESEILAALEAQRNSAAKVAGLEAELVTARNAAATPALERFVPRADYETARNRVAELEAEKAKSAADKLEAEINAAVDGASKAGKISPATVDFYKQACRGAGGLEAFRKFVDAAPVIGGQPPAGGGAPPATPPSTNSHGLTEGELEICRHMGLEPKKFAETKASMK